MNKIIKMILILTIVYILSGCSITNNLFESNINPDTGDEYMNAHLPLYSCKGDHETVKKLLSLGLDYQIDTALECAISSNDLETVKTLINAGADINLKTDKGLNLLLYAVSEKSYNLIDYLLDQGLDPYQEDDEGNNILHYVLDKYFNTYSRKDGSDEEGLFKILKTLKEHEVKIEDMKIRRGIENNLVSPLIYAIAYTYPLVTHALLSVGFEIDLSNEHDLKVIEHKEFASGASSDKNHLLISCMINSYSQISSVHIPPGAWPSCDELFSLYYEYYQISEPIGTATKPYDQLPTDIAEDSNQERAEEERKDNPMFPMTASEALAILQNNYPSYTFLGGGEISDSEYHEGKGINEPAYMYAFRKDEDVYTGWVFADGSYKFRYAGDYVQN